MEQGELGLDLDELDGCDLTVADGETVTDDDLPFVALSPEGDPAKIAAYKELFGG